MLVNNAAVLHLATIDATATDAFERLLRVNVLGPFLGIRTCLPALRASGAGAVVNIGSIDSVQGAALTGAYTASKFALRGLTKVVALENRKRGVRANIVCPMLGNPEMHPEIVGTDSGPMPVGSGKPPDLDVIAEAVVLFRVGRVAVHERDRARPRRRPQRGHVARSPRRVVRPPTPHPR